MANTKYIYRFLIIFFSSFLLGCIGTYNEQLGSHAVKFMLAPSEISFDQEFTITLPREHPSKMSIRDPKGIWHWVQDVEEEIFFLPSSEFERATKIIISPLQVRGVSWVDGKKVDGLVFNYSGEYLVYFADNLETEPENTFYFMGKVLVKGEP